MQLSGAGVLRGRNGVGGLALTLGAFPTLVLVLGLVACGSEVSTSPPVASLSPASSPSALAASTSTPAPCPDSPVTSGLPAPLPALGDSLKLPTSPCSAIFEGTADARSLRTVTVTIGHAGDHPYFQPTLLTGTAGESLRLHVVDSDSRLHNVSIPEQGINLDIAPGGSIDVTVTFPSRGSLVYFCSYHDFEGQAGELLTIGP